MEIGKQHGHFKAGSLQIHQFVYRNKVAEVDLTARFIAGIDSFRGL